ncbi:hypothetical protein Tco_1405937 [Tanacetum coccineum]
MDTTGMLKSALKSSSSNETNLASKVRNIEGKIRMPIRNVTFTKPLNDIISNDVLMGNEPAYDDSIWNSTNVKDATSCMGTKSFVNVVAASKPNPKLNFRTLFNEDKVENTDFVLPVENVMAAQNKFANSLVGFFVGKRVAFPLVQNYVTNTWAKFGFQKVIKDDDDVFYFKFSSITGLEQIHKVPIMAYSEDGLSLIASQIGKPVMLDAFTSSMCTEPWGRIGFARALIEVTAEKELTQEVKMAVPIIEGWWKSRLLLLFLRKMVLPWFKTGKRKERRMRIRNKEMVFNKPQPKYVWNMKKQSNSKDELNVVILKDHFDALKSHDEVVNRNEAGESSKEFHVNLSPLSSVCSKVFRSWEWSSNASLCSKGCRIILGWNKDVVDALIISQTSQAVHTKLIHKADLREMRHLWTDLGFHKTVVRGKPWILLGDFNVALNMEDSLTDINSSGLQYTWNQKPKGKGGTLKKLDRVMGNIDFVDMFPGAYAIFQPYRISDHPPAVLKIPTLVTSKPKPFKLYNFLAHKAKFLETILSEWNSQVNGHFMFQVVKKMRMLNKPLRKLLHDQGNLHDHVNRLRVELDEVQIAIDKDPYNEALNDEEVVYLTTFNEAKIDEEQFLKQKAKIEWLEVGDSNSAYFHKSIKSRNQRSRIEVIRNADNVEFSGSCVPNVSADASDNMVRPVTNDEIKTAMFDIGHDKAPGPDGYTSAFFKKGWDIVGGDVCNAIRDFFGNGKLLKEINHTFLALIPKVTIPTQVNDRRNSDNILITQELMHNYHHDRGPPRCAFKVDIQKAYDTVDWRFLGFVLKCFGFPSTMRKWIMACVTSALFSISINGDIHGFFKGKRGLCQGDPLSPYLFTLVMEMTFFLFTRGELDSAMLIMEPLDEFKMVSGLVPSLPKSTAFFCNVANHVKVSILNIMPFLEEELPVIYLGVPLISSRILNKDCKLLVEKPKGDMSWGWSKLLQLREFVKLFFWIEIGNGLKASLWYDRWCSLSPLIRFLSPRDISREGYSLQACVADLIVNGAWN